MVRVKDRKLSIIGLVWAIFLLIWGLVYLSLVTFGEPSIDMTIFWIFYIVVFLPSFTSIGSKRVRLYSVVKQKQIIKAKGVTIMSESLSQFIGKSCVITTIQGAYLKGIVESIENNWVTLKSENKKNEKTKMVNVEYIINIDER